MITHFLGTEEVRAYLRELVGRLNACDPVPSVWCPITESGVELLRQLLTLVKEDSFGLAEKVKQVLSIYPGRRQGEFKFGGGKPGKDLKGQHVLLFDSAVHSGGTMARAAQVLRRYGAADVCTYALVLKRSSRFIPSLWGVMVNDEDRAYFLLDRTPNNRLTTHLSEKRPYLHLRRLAEEDMRLPPVKCGVASIDRVTWGDRWFDMAESEQNRCTYLLETAKGVIAYLTLRVDGQNRMVIDEVAVDKQQIGRGYGGVLMRFADTLARHCGCRKVRLNAIKEQKGWYVKFGYKIVPGRDSISLDGEEYLPMERVVLYHLPGMSV